MPLLIVCSGPRPSQARRFGRPPWRGHRSTLFVMRTRFVPLALAIGVAGCRQTASIATTPADLPLVARRRPESRNRSPSRRATAFSSRRARSSTSDRRERRGRGDRRLRRESDLESREHARAASGGRRRRPRLEHRAVPRRRPLRPRRRGLRAHVDDDAGADRRRAARRVCSTACRRCGSCCPPSVEHQGGDESTAHHAGGARRRHAALRVARRDARRRAPLPRRPTTSSASSISTRCTRSIACICISPTIRAGASRSSRGRISRRSAGRRRSAAGAAASTRRPVRGHRRVRAVALHHGRARDRHAGAQQRGARRRIPICAAIAPRRSRSRASAVRRTRSARRATSVYPFVGDVVREIVAAAPTPYFHIGGDEVAGLTQGRQYHAFIERVENIVDAAGPRMIGWGEIAPANIQRERHRAALDEGFERRSTRSAAAR